MATLHRVLMSIIHRKYPNLDNDVLIDVAEEMMAYDIEYNVNDYLLAKQSLIRQKQERKSLETLLKTDLILTLQI